MNYAPLFAENFVSETKLFYILNFFQLLNLNICHHVFFSGLAPFGKAINNNNNNPKKNGDSMEIVAS